MSVKSMENEQYQTPEQALDTKLTVSDPAASNGVFDNNKSLTQSISHIISGITYNGENEHYLDDYAGWIGKKPAVVHQFTDSDESHAKFLFDYELPRIAEFGAVPMISLHFFSGGRENTPKNITALIAGGQYDDFFVWWGQKLKVFLSGKDGKFDTKDDRKVYLRPGHEMNGSWYPWSSSPKDYVNAWKRLHNILSQLGIKDKDHIQCIFSVNNIDIGAGKMEEYYPGGQYVDWLGLDGYNKGDRGRRTPEQVFDPMLERLRILAPTKPISVNEVGTVSFEDVSWKNQWIEDAYRYFVDERIQMVTWFNFDKGREDKDVFGKKGDQVFVSPSSGKTYRGYSSYKRAMQKSNIIRAPLSDHYFKGGN